MTETPTPFGQTVRKRREEIGLGLRELARQVPMAAAYLSKIERGQFKPPAEEKIVKIADILDLDRDELLGLAGRVATDLEEAIRQRPGPMAKAVRAFSLFPSAGSDQWSASEEVADPELADAIRSIEANKNLTKEQASILIQGMKISWQLAKQSAERESGSMG